MKTGVAIITFILTIIFSTIAIHNNKIAREIVAREFDLQKHKVVDGQEADVNKTKKAKKEEQKEFDTNWDKKFEKEWSKF